MNVRWTLNVEGFGKIEKASIRISPLMIFAGDNNSGKSYMMSLLWGILEKASSIVLNNGLFEIDTYNICAEWILSQKDKEEIALDESKIQLFIDLFNNLVQQYKYDLVKDIFNADIPIGRIYISDFAHDFPIVIRNKKREPQQGIYQINTTGIEIDISSIPSESMFDVISNFLIEIICVRIVLGDFSFTKGMSIYLPASRTGFMLTYKTLAQKAVKIGFGTRKTNVVEIGKLTTPVSDFLSELIGLEFSNQSPYCSIAAFLEEKILQGKIQKDTSPIPNFFYKPNDLNQELSLHVTSSLVAELSPIIIFLKSNKPMISLIIEEPEAHLHLEMQKQMARALVRLVNAGLPVWITTHSDTLVQQINNLIKLNNHSNRQKIAETYGYEEADFLDAEKATFYQFNSEPQKTVVQSLPLTSNGFAIPTFTESLMALAKETIALMENDDDEDDDQ